MKNESISKGKVNNWLVLLLLLIVLIGSILFYVFSIRQKQSKIVRIENFKKEISNINHQLFIIEKKINNARTITKYETTSQIYGLIAENAAYHNIILKRFMAVKDTNELEMVLVGTFPDVIGFFNYLWQSKFFLIKKIELKSSQEPKYSVEIGLKLAVPTVKGGK